MPTDLHLLPLHRRAGEDTTAPLPGLYLASPPRKGARNPVARSRQTDQLILHLTFTGTATLNADLQNQLLARLTETYYQTSGAATSALRTLVESLNTFLLDRNLRAESKGLQTIGLLTAIVLRHDQLLLAQSGPTHLFVIEETQYQHLYDPQTAGHGLGLGKIAGLLINYLTPTPGTLLLLSPAPPPAWNNPALQTAYGRPLKTIQRGLLKPAGPDLHALLIQIQAGTGKVILHKTAPAEPSVKKTETEVEKTISASPPAEPVSPTDPDPAQAEPEPARDTIPAQKTEPAPVPAPSDAEPPEPTEVETRELPVAVLPAHPAFSQPAPPETAPPPSTSEPPSRAGRSTSPKESKPSPIGPALLAIGRATREALRQLGYTLRALLTRLLPGSDLFTIPASTMIFIAIAVPILLSITALFVYQQRGRAQQYAVNLQYAQAAKLDAQGKTTPAEQRTAWSAVIFYLDQAEQYQTTEESAALRLEAQTLLDQLDTIVRLDFIPVLPTPLADNVTISRMAASAEDLYLLNRDVGNVVRIWQSGRGYETDQTFRCGPIPNESLIVGPLIDIAVLPPVNYLDAQVMGMDANGILVYCLNDADAPIPVPLFPPDSNWGSPRAFALDNDILYVLDPQTNAVWVYYGQNYEFSTRPRFFFDADVPTLTDVIDLAVDRGELYLLHETGHITRCTFGFDVQPTRCTPAEFADARAGMANGPLLAGTLFTEIAYTPPPGPSIFLLDASQQALYHLSVSLALQRQYRPTLIGDTPHTPATAFVVSPNRLAYLAFGNEVWVAALP
ncbi:MAG: hypothetical protein Fur0022_45930 [Anaerolineales bacterium]